jgi:putative redox protein
MGRTDLTAMVKVTIEYIGQLHCSATHGPSGAAIETDAPVDNQGKGESFSPTDLVATALGSCMATTMGIYARQKGIAIEGMRVEVGKEMTQSGPRKIARLTTDIYMPEGLEQNSALENAALTCPVHRSLHPDVEKPVNFHWS